MQVFKRLNRLFNWTGKHQYTVLVKWLITILLVIILALQYQMWLAPGGYRDVRQLKLRLEGLSHENEQLLLRNQTLEAKVKDLKQGLQTVEERARSELGMIKDGETFYHIIEKKTKPTTNNDQ